MSIQALNRFILEVKLGQRWPVQASGSRVMKFHELRVWAEDGIDAMRGAALYFASDPWHIEIGRVYQVSDSGDLEVMLNSNFSPNFRDHCRAILSLDQQNDFFQVATADYEISLISDEDRQNE